MVLCASYSFAAQEGVAAMLQAAAGEAAAWVLWLQPGTHEQTLGADEPCVASPCLPGTPHAVGMRRRPKPALPQGDLSVMAPGVFTSEQHGL